MGNRSEGGIYLTVTVELFKFQSGATMNEFAVAFIREFIPPSPRFRRINPNNIRYITDGVNWVLKKYYNQPKLRMGEVAMILRHCGIQEKTHEENYQKGDEGEGYIPKRHYGIDTVAMKHLRMATKKLPKYIGAEQEQQINELIVRLREWKGPQIAR